MPYLTQTCLAATRISQPRSRSFSEICLFRGNLTGCPGWSCLNLLRRRPGYAPTCVTDISLRYGVPFKGGGIEKRTILRRPRASSSHSPSSDLSSAPFSTRAITAAPTRNLHRVSSRRAVQSRPPAPFGAPVFGPKFLKPFFGGLDSLLGLGRIASPCCLIAVGGKS